METKELRDKLMHSNGTTPYETISLIVPSAFYMIATTLLTSLLRTYSVKNPLILFCVEFTTLIIPIILNITILVNHTLQLLTASIIICISLVILIRGTKITAKKPSLPFQYRDCMTNFRSTISAITVVAILAVDFHIFPRRLAKTENFGYSLMDVGVGLFMVANGIIDDGKTNTIKAFKQCLPLLILGTIRLLLTRQLDYHVPVSEYGVHWNFFITLAITKIFATLIFNIINIKFIWINATLLMISHEILLECGLKNFVISNKKRTNFISANKEGLVSGVGYVCLYLFSTYIGQFVNLKKDINNKSKLIIKFMILSFVTLLLAMVFEKYFGISRKLANSAYCFWILFIAVFMWSIFYTSGKIVMYTFKNKSDDCIYSPLIFQAINYNALLFFLMCNLTTGLVNILCDTLKVGTAISLVIICMYMFTNCLLVYVLYQKQIKLKL